MSPGHDFLLASTLLVSSWLHTRCHNILLSGGLRICVWQAPAKDNDGNLEKDFYIAGFRGVEIDFSVNISEAEKMILLLGPNKPPFEYIANLQKIISRRQK